MNSSQWASVFNAEVGLQTLGRDHFSQHSYFQHDRQNLKACVLCQFGPQIAFHSIRHFSKLTNLPYMLRVRLRSGT
jgi:hypothetical protein